MSGTVDLTECSPERLQAFVHEFDVVLSDCDGVLWYVETPIEGAIETLKKFQDLGKRLYLVSNNSTVNVNRYCEKMRKLGLEITPDQIIITSKVIAWYLKKINFSGEAFAIASPAFREVLTEAGIKLTADQPGTVESDPLATIRAIEDRPSVKAVIADFSITCDWGRLAFGISCLKRKDVLYLCGAQDEWVIYAVGKRLLGPGPLINVLTKHSERTPIECAKPSEVLKDYILEMCNVENPARCLFIGDTVNYDMKFGTMCGFSKLFVNTGCDKLEDAQKDEEARPDYFIESLGQLYPLIDNLPVKPLNNKEC